MIASGAQRRASQCREAPRRIAPHRTAHCSVVVTRPQLRSVVFTNTVAESEGSPPTRCLRSAGGAVTLLASSVGIPPLVGVTADFPDVKPYIFIPSELVRLRFPLTAHCQLAGCSASKPDNCLEQLPYSCHCPVQYSEEGTCASSFFYATAFPSFGRSVRGPAGSVRYQ